ncbi:MAG: glycosyltransferase family 2 protein [Vicinamibacterales bacterium]
MRIAVLIVNWNAGAHLERALAAVATQTLPAHRVIVLDNASTDGSVSGMGRRPGIELIPLSENVGFAAGNNIAAGAAADCDWLAFLNPDAFPQPGWLDTLAAAAHAHPAVTMFASELRLDADPTTLDGAGDAYHVSGLPWRVGHGQPASLAPAAPSEAFSPCGAAALVRRDVFEEVGGFDPSFFCYVEDVDLAFRLRLRGHRCLYVPGAIVRHVGSASTGLRSDFASYHGHRNLVWAWVKNMPAGWVWLYAPQHLLLTVASFVRFGASGHLGAIVRAKWDALRGLPRVLAERRRVQATRTVSGRQIVRAMTTGWLTPYRTHLRRRK